MKIANRYYFGGAALIMILGLAASCTRNLSVTPSIVSTPTPVFTNTPASTNTSTFTSTNTPTVTATPTNTSLSPTATPTNTLTFTNTFTPAPPTNTFTNTPTPTNTLTNTPTNTYTPTTPPTKVFEDWEGPYPGGNHWAGYYTTCAQANYVVNPASSGEAITVCYDNTPGDPHSGTYCLKNQITWAVCGPTQYAQEGIDSSYSGYGFPVSIDSSTNAVQNPAGVPVSISIWVKCDTVGQQFTVYFQDATPGSGSPVRTTHYQNGTGSNVLFSITTAGVWQNIQLPLTAGTSIWDVDPTTMNWNAILDIGVVYAPPPGCATNQVITFYMDDYAFVL